MTTSQNPPRGAGRAPHQNRGKEDRPEGGSQRQGALGSSQGDAGAREGDPVRAPRGGTDAPSAGGDPRTGAPAGQRGKIGSNAASERASDRAGVGAVSRREGDGVPPGGSAPSAEGGDATEQRPDPLGTSQTTSSSGRRGGR